ncbi:MAG: hypothetical protein V4722_02060 [Bacteroidota bacterium]
MKSDTTIKNICVAAAKRHTIKPIDFPFTTLFDGEHSGDLSNQITFSESELPISQTFIAKSNWTLVTTRRIVSCINGQVRETAASNVNSWNWGNFKGYKGEHTSIGEIKLDSGDVINIHIEAGRASMIIIYSIMTLVGQLKK